MLLLQAKLLNIPVNDCLCVFIRCDDPASPRIAIRGGGFTDPVLAKCRGRTLRSIPLSSHSRRPPEVWCGVVKGDSNSFVASVLVFGGGLRKTGPPRVSIGPIVNSKRIASSPDGHLQHPSHSQHAGPCSPAVKSLELAGRRRYRHWVPSTSNCIPPRLW